MNNRRELFASVISDNPKKIFRNLKIYEKMGISGIHFDVMDGIFVPRFGLYPELMEAIRAESKLPIEVHLMVSNVAPYLKRFASAGATRIIIHLETLQHPKSIISQIHEMGIEVGIALNPTTHIDSLNKIISEVEIQDSLKIKESSTGIIKDYTLKSTINHTGNLYNGHYTNYINLIHWMYVDDQLIKVSPFNGKDAYILFYSS